MADELDLSEDDKSTDKSKILIFGGAAVVVIAAVATLYFMGVLSTVQENWEKQGDRAEIEETEIPKTPIYLSLDPAFVVSFANKKDAELFQLSVSVLSYQQEIIDAIEKHKPMIRNNLLLILSTQDPSMLKISEGKNQLRTEVLGAITKVVKEIEGLDGIEEVFFTKFVMQ